MRPLRRCGPPAIRSIARSAPQIGRTAYKTMRPTTPHHTGLSNVSDCGRPAARSRVMIARSSAMKSVTRSAQIMALSLLMSVPALATEQITVPPCNMSTNSAGNKSGTYQSDAQLFAAPPQGVTRTGMFVQCLTASCLFALNMSGGTASLTAAGNIVINGQYGFFNAASFGFVPQDAVRIIASGSSVITAYACPQ